MTWPWRQEAVHIASSRACCNLSDGTVTTFAALRVHGLDACIHVCSRNIEKLVIWQLWLNRSMYFIPPVHAVWCTHSDRKLGS